MNFMLENDYNLVSDTLNVNSLERIDLSLLPVEIWRKIMAINYTSSFKLSCINRISLYEHKMSQLKQFYENFKPYFHLDTIHSNFKDFLESHCITIILTKNVHFDIPYDFSIMKNLTSFVFICENMPKYKLRNSPLFPHSLERLCITGCQIKEIKNLPPTLIELTLCRNNISEMKNLPVTLKHIDLSDNNISVLKNILNVESLIIKNNPIILTPLVHSLIKLSKSLNVPSIIAITSPLDNVAYFVERFDIKYITIRRQHGPCFKFVSK